MTKASEGSVNKNEKIEISAEQFQNMMNRLNELEKNNQVPVIEDSGPLISGGRVIGEEVLNELNIKKYEDPTIKIKADKRWRKFEEDHDVVFGLKVKAWTTKQGVNQKAARMTLVITRQVFDEETDKLLGHAIVARGNFKEYDYDTFNNWVHEKLRVRKPKVRKKATDEMVIGGTAVEFVHTEKEA